MTVRRVLIVDDSRVSRMMIRSAMSKQHPDWVYEEAGDADTAVAQVTAAAFDLVSMDYTMPGVNGLEVASMLRQIRPDLAVVLFTANVQQTIRDRAASLGVTFVDKPVSEASIARVLAVLDA